MPRMNAGRRSTHQDSLGEMPLQARRSGNDTFPVRLPHRGASCCRPARNDGVARRDLRRAWCKPVQRRPAMTAARRTIAEAGPSHATIRGRVPVSCPACLHRSSLRTGEHGVGTLSRLPGRQVPGYGPKPRLDSVPKAKKETDGRLADATSPDSRSGTRREDWRAIPANPFESPGNWFRTVRALCGDDGSAGSVVAVSILASIRRCSRKLSAGPAQSQCRLTQAATVEARAVSRFANLCLRVPRIPKGEPAMTSSSRRSGPFIGPLLTRSFVRRICSACRLVSVSLMLERWSGCVAL